MELLAIRNAIETEEFDYNCIKDVLKSYKNPRVKINDLLKKECIIRIKKGLYVFGAPLSKGPYSKEVLANLIYGPSYVSLDYALSFYGLIPERVETVTSITNKRNKIFKTPIGVFSYKYINPLNYSLGITLCKLDKYHTIIIATKEKALADTLYFSDKIEDASQMKEYLFENLRIDMHEFKKCNIREMKKLADLYGHNVALLCAVWEGMK